LGRRQGVNRRSFFDLGDLRKDLFHGIHASVPRAGADLTNAGPCLGAFDVLRPKRPGSALDRSSRIDGTPSLLVPEDAIAAGFFDEAIAILDATDEFGGELPHAFAAKLGDLADLLA